MKHPHNQSKKNQNRVWWPKAGFILLAILLLLSFQLIRPDESPGPLSSFHTELEGEQNCSKCHNEDYETDPEKCLNCHLELKQRIEAEKGFHQDKNEGCEACHPEHQGEDAVLIDWDKEDFEHAEIGCSLSGVHQKIKNCRECHRPPNQIPRKKGTSYLMKSSHCTACHISPHLEKYPSCTDCHTQVSWRVDPW
jgi:uncharacterized paraquat-inducible protein A